MKRFAAGVVAAATALSLSTGVASAAQPGEHIVDGFVKEVVSGPHWESAKGSSDSLQNENSSKAWGNFYQSSYDNDDKQDYKVGTTADILWGVGITAAVLGAAYTAVQNGLVPGVSLPF
ncbi:hypothetical protein [uncultured Corynebacterium sp.]|uniref:hypothetical protein n=1 Tax=uncultured Corynebacterium sp. TaxID=159447 RepID=UPI0025CFD041|nr:hypothetical protein [uncultured Corynebacterium sp.]